MSLSVIRLTPLFLMIKALRRQSPHASDGLTHCCDCGGSRVAIEKIRSFVWRVAPDRWGFCQAKPSLQPYPDPRSRTMRAAKHGEARGSHPSGR